MEKFGFRKENHQYIFIRKTDDGIPIYNIYVTRTHRYIQITTWGTCTIAGSAQDLIYDLIKADLIEKN